MACPVCNSKNSVEMYPSQLNDTDRVSFSYTFSPEHNKTHRVLRCPDCTHAYCDPVPQEISENYKNVVDAEYLKHAASRQLSAGAVISLLKKIKPSGRLLDVGCATGDFMLVAKNYGYQAEGLELSDWSASLARERGFTVHKEYLKSMAAKHAGQYDVITLMGVIEHFARPSEEMDYIRTLLAEDGIIALWTGDVDSMTSRALGRRWWYWQGQHIQYFTHSSLKKLMKMCGFVHVKTKTYPFTATQETISNSLRRYRSHKILNRLLRPIFAIKPVWNLRLPGEMLFIGRRARQ